MGLAVSEGERLSLDINYPLIDRCTVNFLRLGGVDEKSIAVNYKDFF